MQMNQVQRSIMNQKSIDEKNQPKDIQNLEPFQFFLDFTGCQFQFIASSFNPVSINLYHMSYISYTSFQKDFQLVKQLGEGKCAKVFKIRHRKSKQLFALKLSTYPNFQDYVQCTAEIEIIKQLSDEATPRIYYYFFNGPNEEKQCHQQIQTEVGIILELCDFTLEQEVFRIKKGMIFAYNSTEIWDMMSQLVRFFAKMQRMNLYHRDIKPGNIMIKIHNKNKKFKVIDFGYAIKQSPYSAENITGTSGWVSPKVQAKFRNSKIQIPGINEKDDVFSLGKTIMYVLYLREINNQSLTSKHWAKSYKLYDANIVDILQKMLLESEEQRWDFIRIQEEMKKIQELKQASQIILDDSNLQEIMSEQQDRPLYPSQYQSISQFDSSLKNLVSSKTIQIQTQPIKYEDFLVEYEKTFKKENKQRYSQDTIYIENNQQQFYGSVERVFVNRCDFERQIYCMKAFEDYLLFGMSNSIGVVSLKHKNDAIYVLELTNFDGVGSALNLTKIQVIGTVIVFIFTSSTFYFCDIKLFIKEIQSIFMNHEELMKKKELKQIPRRIIYQNYRNPKIFQKKLDFLKSYKSISKVRCISMGDFCGVQNNIVIGHYDGQITALEKQVIYKQDSAIMDIMVLDQNKILFSTHSNQIKMLVFDPNRTNQTKVISEYQFSAQQKIQFFQIFLIQKNQVNQNLEQQQVFLSVYLENGQKVQLDHNLQHIKTITLLKMVQISKIVQSEWRWSISISKSNSQENINAERKIAKNALNQTQNMVYLISKDGKLYSKERKQFLFNLSIQKPISLHVSHNLIVAVNLEGNVKILYIDRIIDNVLKQRPQPDTSGLSQFLKSSHHFLRAITMDETQKFQGTKEITQPVIPGNMSFSKFFKTSKASQILRQRGEINKRKLEEEIR